MSKKMKLNDIKVQSFVTSLTDVEAKKLKGGYTLCCTEGYMTLCDTFCDASEYNPCIPPPPDSYFCSRGDCPTEESPDCGTPIPE